MALDDSFFNFGAAHRASDNHGIVAYWNAPDNATADLRVVDIASSASIIQKTNIITDQAESLECSVFINQQNDAIY